MVSTNQKPAVKKKRPPPRIVKVLRVTTLTPHMVRITFGGDGLDGFERRGTAEHIRLYLPDQATGKVILPVPGPKGNAFPEDQERPRSRAYTPRRWDAEIRELDVDFVVHNDGPGSAYVSTFKAGDVAVISGQPGGPYIPEADVDWYLIAGDEAALPAICTVLEVLEPSITANVMIEVLNEAEEQELASCSAMNTTWIHRHSEDGLPGVKLASALRDVVLPEGNGRIWISCEASIMRDIRRHFLEERGIDRSVLRTQGYWKAGTTNHSDSDMGEDI